MLSISPPKDKYDRPSGALWLNSVTGKQSKFEVGMTHFIGLFIELCQAHCRYQSLRNEHHALRGDPMINFTLQELVQTSSRVLYLYISFPSWDNKIKVSALNDITVMN